MDRLDRLLIKAKPKLTLCDRLQVNNPYWGKSFDELIDYMDSDIGMQVPENGTLEYVKFMFALLQAYTELEEGEEVYG